MFLGLYWARNPLAQLYYADVATEDGGRHEDSTAEDSRANGVRGRIEAPYSDDLLSTTDEQSNGTLAEGTSADHEGNGGLALQPSRLRGDGNA